MRGASILVGGPRFPDLTVAKRENITYLVWEARDKELDADLLDWARKRGYICLVMRDPSWPSQYGASNCFIPPQFNEGERTTQSAVALAGTLSADIFRLGAGAQGTTKAQLAVMPDIEHVHDAKYVMDFYNEFRRLRSGRGIYLTTEWHQAGWFSRELIGKINSDRFFWHLPQAYEGGEMRPVDPRPVIADDVAHGIEPSKIQVFLRADRLDIGWDGWVYDYIKAR
jgi:hypothetical protein